MNNKREAEKIYESIIVFRKGDNGDARREKTSLDLFALFVPKTVPGSRRLFARAPPLSSNPFGRLVPLKAIHFNLLTDGARFQCSK